MTHPPSLGGMYGLGQRVSGPVSPRSPPLERGSEKEYISLNLLLKIFMGFEYKCHMGCLRNEEDHRLICCGDNEKEKVTTD